MSFVFNILFASTTLTSVHALTEALHRQDTNATFSLVATVSSAYANYAYFSIADASGAVTLTRCETDEQHDTLPPFAPGDRVRVSGRIIPPRYVSCRAFCASAEILSRGVPPRPQDITLRDMTRGAFDACPVRVRSRVIDAFRDEGDQEWVYLVISSEGDVAYAAFRDMASERERFRLWIGCDVILTGLVHPDEGGARHHFGRMLIAEGPGAVHVVRWPSWWTPAKFASVIGILTAFLLASIVWIRSLRVLVERRSRELLREQVAHAAAELRIAERTRLASDLHDSVSQNLTGAALQLSTALRLEAANPVEMHRQLVCVSRTIRACRNELRNCLQDLRSEALDAPNMNEAIRRTLQPRLAEADIVIRFNVSRARLADQTAHTILQIVRELVANAIAHGHARHIRIAGAIEEHRLLFSVRDDGIGFDPDAVSGPQEGHFGLQGIRERIRRHDGSFDIVRLNPSGTKVTVMLK